MTMTRSLRQDRAELAGHTFSREAILPAVR
jgi:hypothetical protein